MANQEHVEIIKQGSETVNQYLGKHPDVMFDLRNADFSDADLKSMDLRGAILSGANLRNTNLRMANLRSADLRFADLTDANLSYARFDLSNLSRATLRNAYVSHTCFQKANLSHVDFRNANGSETNISGANLTGAKVHKLKTAKWQAINLICEWLNLSPNGEDSPKAEHIWKPNQGIVSPFEESAFEKLVFELITDASFPSLTTTAQAFGCIAACFERIEPEPRLEWSKFVFNDDRCEIHLAASETALAALARLLEGAIRSLRTLAGKALIEDIRPLSLDPEENAKSTAFVRRLQLENHPEVTSAILHLARLTRSIFYRGESFLLKETQSLFFSSPFDSQTSSNGTDET
ncbi:MAG: pentapeptide repeat-containing protein [Candidatus Omnitrophota bacterium]|jgi:hypothetical protein|nr:MAG: pentapeptide repeat-containing protein [Candidatus Omnitrophota bacterium]